jgi:hypothetical protein
VIPLFFLVMMSLHAIPNSGTKFGDKIPRRYCQLWHHFWLQSHILRIVNIYHFATVSTMDTSVDASASSGPSVNCNYDEFEDTPDDELTSLRSDNEPMEEHL